MTEQRTPYTFSRRLGGGSGLLTGWVGIPDPLSAGHLARENFDAIVLDMQHGQLDLASTIAAIAQIALAGKPAIVRVPVGDFATATQVLDAGAVGIIAPMINSVDDARRLVSFTKYPPLGERSWGAGLALNMHGQSAADYLSGANAAMLALPMIETVGALAALDDILAVDGIDGVFLGPYDLSIALSGGTLNAMHPDVEAAIDRVAERCRAHGKLAVAMAGDGPRARHFIAKGYDLVALGPDSAQLREGARINIDAART
ncbi:MAG: hydroxyacid aldolase [Pelagibacterium sp. SCN 64-44]|nr:MAG: hydroxyacid aldolase [Pelagibacterium sp. SCN 64-44]